MQLLLCTELGVKGLTHLVWSLSLGARPLFSFYTPVFCFMFWNPEVWGTKKAYVY
jgi:hypothetical protein